MPDKHEVGGSSPLGPTISPKGEKTLKRVAGAVRKDGKRQTFIENRINGK